VTTRVNAVEREGVCARAQRSERKSSVHSPTCEVTCEYKISTRPSNRSLASRHRSAAAAERSTAVRPVSVSNCSPNFVATSTQPRSSAWLFSHIPTCDRWPWCDSGMVVAVSRCVGGEYMSTWLGDQLSRTHVICSGSYTQVMEHAPRNDKRWFVVQDERVRMWVRGQHKHVPIEWNQLHTENHINSLRMFAALACVRRACVVRIACADCVCVQRLTPFLLTTRTPLLCRS
jgi:hypothetical protein